MGTADGCTEGRADDTVLGWPLGWEVGNTDGCDDGKVLGWLVG